MEDDIDGHRFNSWYGGMLFIDIYLYLTHSNQVDLPQSTIGHRLILAEIMIFFHLHTVLYGKL
jgi:hypothetical protein